MKTLAARLRSAALRALLVVIVLVSVPVIVSMVAGFYSLSMIIAEVVAIALMIVLARLVPLRRTLSNARARSVRVRIRTRYGRQPPLPSRSFTIRSDRMPAAVTPHHTRLHHSRRPAPGVAASPRRGWVVIHHPGQPDEVISARESASERANDRRLGRSLVRRTLGSGPRASRRTYRAR